MKKLSIILLFSFFTSIIFSQELTKNDFIAALSNLRSEILTRNEKYTQEYDSLVTMIVKSEIDDVLKTDLIKELDNLIFNIGKEVETELDPLLEKEQEWSRTNKKIIKLDSSLKANEFSKRYDQLVDNLVGTALRVSELIHVQSFLNEKYPFALKREHHFYDMFEEIEFKRNDVVADIGCGMASQPILYAMLDLDMEIYAQEINEYLIGLYDNDFKQSNFDLSKIRSVKGRIKNTNLEELIFDKIIIHNTFHHFSKHNQMMKSIMKSMDRETKLIIIDLNRNKSDLSLEGTCQEILPENVTESRILDHPLKLVKKKEVGKWIYWEFVLN